MDVTPVSCPDVDQNLWRYIDRELSASALAAISSHLRVCESCQGLYHERARDASNYRMVFVDTPFGEPFVVNLKKRLRQEGPSPGTAVAARRRRYGLFSLHQRKVRRAVTVLAMLILIPVVIVIGILQKQSDPVRLGSFKVEGGTANLIPSDDSGRAGREGPGDALAARTEGYYAAGEALEVPELATATLAYGDSRITLEGPAFLRIGQLSNRDEFQGYLQTGRLTAVVARRDPRNQPFEIRTPHAMARVTGTVFTLDAKATETVLEVMEGTVSFAPVRALTGTSIEDVEAGETFRIRKNGAEAEPVTDVSRRGAADAAEEEPEPTPEEPREEAAARPSGGATIHAAPAEEGPAVPAPTEAPKPRPRGPNDELDQPVSR